MILRLLEASQVTSQKQSTPASDEGVWRGAFQNVLHNIDERQTLKPASRYVPEAVRQAARAAKASSTVGRPDELQILNLTYRVIFSSQEEMIVSGTMGFCSVDAQLIVVAEDQANDAMQDTFLHEVFTLTAAFDLRRKTKKKASCAD